MYPGQSAVPAGLHIAASIASPTATTVQVCFISLIVNLSFVAFCDIVCVIRPCSRRHSRSGMTSWPRLCSGILMYAP